MNKKKKSTLKSNCCNAPIRLGGGIGDFAEDDKQCTLFAICTKCNNPCDIKSKTRKTWAINPKTKVVPNKKKKNEKLFTDKELKKFREEEDY